MKLRGTMARRRPRKLTIRTYQVGFGDCFLLSFAYAADDERHLLIDFGSTAMPGGIESARQMRAVAEDIRMRTGGKLHGVVATHRHKDHIGGFALGKKGRGPGAVIRDLEPDIVVQPWTERPDLAVDANHPGATLTPGAGRQGLVAHVASLAAMQGFARDVGRELMGLRGGLSPAMAEQLSFIGDDNIANEDAVRNLMAMGRKRSYVHFGARSGLEPLLPGVKVRVLGPPTPKQSKSVRTQRVRDDAEFWHLQARTRDMPGLRRGPAVLFPRARRHRRGQEPVETRWLINHARSVRGEQLLGIVRALDNAINNTSLILLFEIGRKKLLFPGDAQIENWSYALSRKSTIDRLRDTDVYKVGHHGSLNATPKSLFNLFERRRSKQPRRQPLIAIMSTLTGKHGDKDDGTEVPRDKLVMALTEETDLRTTESIKTELFFDVTIDF